MKQKPKIAIIGAGLAGLSAAVHLHENAHVSVFESSTIAGGRARTLNKSTESFKTLDNGQHILLAGYHSTLTLLKKLDVDLDEAFFRSPLKWWMDTGLQLNLPAILSPFNLAVGLMCARGISAKEKINCLKSLYELKNVTVDETVTSWLQKHNVASKLQYGFWQPLVLAALNTPVNEASILTLREVVRHGILNNQHISDLLLPKKDLGAIFAKPAQAFLASKKVRVSLNHRINSLVGKNLGQVHVDDEQFDAVLVATAPHQAANLIDDKDTQAILNTLQYARICTVYLRYKEEISFPFPMVGVAEGTAQWLFDRQALVGAKNEVAAVISCAPEMDKELLVQKVHEDVKKWYPVLEFPIDYKVIVEKRATFKSLIKRPNLNANVLSRQGIYLAGDYMHPSYPATIEGAIQSGQIAAEQCLLDWKNYDQK